MVFDATSSLTIEHKDVVRSSGQKVNCYLTEIMRRTCLLILFVMSATVMSGCIPLVLYGPRTYYTAETSVIAAPFKRVSAEYNKNASESPVSISLGDPDSSKLKYLRFANATMTNEDGVVTQLRLRTETLENPNSFVMDFYKVDYLGHDLHFRVTVLSNGVPIVITFQTRFESKVVWPKDSDYSG